VQCHCIENDCAHADPRAVHIEDLDDLYVLLASLLTQPDANAMHALPKKRGLGSICTKSHGKGSLNREWLCNKRL